MLGTLGIYVIKAILDYEIKKFVNTTIIDKVKSLAEVICAKDYLPNGADEILVGRAGFLAAVLTLRLVRSIFRVKILHSSKKFPFFV